MKNIISIDVEDWFHILELETTPKLAEWTNLESRVEKNFYRMLDILDESNVKATCFFLGWVAENKPHLVKEAARRNHEIASHGYAHQLVYAQTEIEFFEDIRKTKRILEDATGEEVIGYRAPGFSITPKTPWAIPALARAGYRYDSSFFPAKRGHGYFLESKLQPFKITDLEFYEFPITVVNFLSQRVCFFGGGYLRLFPYSLIQIMAGKVAQENRPVIYYIHPREIDVNHPRLSMNTVRRFKSYVNLSTTESKLRKIAGSNQINTFSEFINESPEYFTSSQALPGIIV